MGEFISSMLASLAAAMVTVVLGALFAKRARQRLYDLVARVFNIEMYPAFRHQRDSEDFLAEEIKRANKVYILAGRGKILESSTCEPLWSRSNRRLSEIRVLLPNPKADHKGGWLQQREQETLSHDENYVAGRIAQQIRGVVMQIDARATPKTEVRFYDFPHLCRLIITDRVILFTPYSDQVHGTESPCYQIRPPGELYDFFVRYFAKVWDAPSTCRHVLPKQTN